MNYQYIEQLIERYFAAETTVAEERILRAFFAEGEVPSHLQQYAPLFAFTEQEQNVPEVLGEDFDEKLLARLRAKGDMPEVHVRAMKMTLGARLRPLGRAAAAVALLITVATTVHEAVDKTMPTRPVDMEAFKAERSIDSSYTEDHPYRQLQDGLKMAVENDSFRLIAPRH